MKKQNGITLIALVISIIVMLILAGVSINAIVGENGVLTKAQNAKLTSEEAARLEELELILFEYNSSEFLGESDGFAAFLADKKADGTIQDYIYLDNLIVKYKDGYYEAESDGEYYSIKGKMEDDLTGGGLSNDYIITPDNLTNNMEFQAGSSYVVLDKVSGEDFNFEIPAGDPVTIKLVGDMTIDNKGYKRSAIDLAEGATLNLHVYGNVTVNSGYGEAGADSDSTTVGAAKGGKGAYAGIHVPEGATLNLYGEGIITAIAGNAGNGGGTSNAAKGGAGGGGAGAGIGGHGGQGGNGSDNEIVERSHACGEDGYKGENCGNVNIYNSLTVYAYGGAGGSGGVSTSSSGGGGGGYPGAGIGGGGAGAGGGDHIGGGGGYTGGNQERDGLVDPSLANIVPVNGNAGNPTTIQNTRSPGGGYFQKAGDAENFDGTTNWIGGGGALGGGGGYTKMSGWSYSYGGDGGVAGNGGNVKVSEKAKVYAYNGNKYTDGTAYNNGANAVEIYAQKGVLLKIERSLGWWSDELNTYYSELFGKEISYTTCWGAEFAMGLLREETTCDILSYGQGIGSGAGYIEISNGTYTVDSSMN